MKLCCYLMLLLITGRTNAIELSDLPRQENMETIFSDISRNPTQYLPHYTEHPTQSHLVNENSELINVEGAENHESAQLVSKVYQDHSRQVAALPVQTNHTSKVENDLKQALNDKYYDCQKTVQCAIPELSQDDDFKKAVTNMAVISEATKVLPGTTNEHISTIFQGKAYQCRTYGFGFLNCCQDAGWGQFVSECSQEEIALRQAREKGTAIFLGTKKTGSKFKKKKYDVYCVFDSKLAKIVQEHGRYNQLYLSFGDADYPNCRGISPSELSQIDFDRMNLSEAYSSVSNNLVMIDQKAISADIAQKMNAIQNDAKK